MLTNDTAAKFVQTFEPELNREQAIARYWTLWHSDKGQNRLNRWRHDGSAASDARDDLLPALLIVEEKFKQIPRQWPFIYRRALTTEEGERVAELKGLALAQLRAKGAPITRDIGSLQERFIYNLMPNELALGMPIEQHQIEDGTFLDIAQPILMAFAESFVQSEEILHANYIQQGRVLNPRIGGDGASLFHEQHPIENGTYSNILGNHHLNQAVLEEAGEFINKLPLMNGRQSRAHPMLLVVPIRLQFAAHRLMQAVKEKFGGDHPKGYPAGYMVLDYLNDPNAWYLTTSLTGLVSMEDAPFTLDLKIEDGKIIIEATHSYAIGHINPRGIIASYPAND